jgi:phage-related protein
LAKEKDVGGLKAKVSLDTVEFNKSMKNLSAQMSAIDNAFKLASASLDKTKNAMQLAELRSDSLTKKIALQKDIIEALRQRYQEASGKLGEASTTTIKYGNDLTKAETQLKNLQNQLKATNEQLKSNSLISAETADRIKLVGDAFDKAGQRISDVGKTLSLGVTAPMLAIGAGIMKLNDTAAEYGDTITKMADRTGMSIKQLQELKYVTSNLDIEFNTIQSTMSMFVNKMKGLDSESNTYTEALKQLGISTKDANGETKKTGDIYTEALQKLSEMTNETDRGVLASKLFGRGWMELTPLLKAGKDEIARLTEEAHKNGLIMSDEAVISADQYEHAMLNLKQQFSMAFFEISQNFMPIIQNKLVPFIKSDVVPVLKGFGDKISDVISWFQRLDSGTQKTIGVIAGVAVAAGPTLVIIGKLTAAVQLLTTAFLFLARSPIVLALTGIAAAVGAIVYAVNKADGEVQSMTTSLINSYRKEAEAQKKAVDAAHASRINSLNKQMTAAQSAYDTRMRQLQSEYDTTIKGAQKSEKAVKDSVQEQITALDDAHSKAVKRIQDEYGVFEKAHKSRTQKIQEEAKTRIDALDKELETAQKVHDENIQLILEEFGEEEKVHKSKIQLLQEEYDKNKELLDKALDDAKAETEAKIKAVNEYYGVEEKNQKSLRQQLIDNAELAKKAQDDRVARAKEACDAEIAAIEEEYGSYEKAQKSKTALAVEFYDGEVKKAQEAHKIKLGLLDTELAKEKERVDRNTNLIIGGLEDQISALFGATEEEIAQARRSREEKAAIALEELIANETDAEQRKKLIAEREALITRLIQTSSNVQLEIKKWQIREEILAELQRAADKKRILDQETANQRAQLEAQLQFEISSINNRRDTEITAIQKAKDERINASKAVLAQVTEEARIEKAVIDNNLQTDLIANEAARVAAIQAERDKLAETTNRINYSRQLITQYYAESLAQIGTERAQAIAAESEKLRASQSRIATEKADVTAKANSAIADTQRELKSKLDAEDDKYKKAKSVLDQQLASMDNWLPQYQERLNDELRRKQSIEADKLQATQNRIKDELAAEQRKIADEKNLIDTAEKAREQSDQTKKIKQLLADLVKWQNWLVTSTTSYEVGEANQHINDIKKQLHALKVPGFAAGVVNWRGGLARINEGSKGEIVNLPRGTNVIPHDISMEIARTVGQQLGNAGGPILQDIKVYVNADELQKAAHVVRLFENIGQTARQGIAPAR